MQVRERDPEREGREACGEHLEAVSEHDEEVRSRARERPRKAGDASPDGLSHSFRRIVVAEEIHALDDAEPIVLDLTDGGAEPFDQVHPADEEA